MPNKQPIYARIGDVSSDGTTAMAPTLTTAAADYVGTNANNLLVFTADPTNGSIIRALKFTALGTNVQTVARIYINNGSAPTTAGNNTLFDTFSLAATTASANSAEPGFLYPFPGDGIALPPGFRIYVGLGTTVAAGWRVSAIGGKY